MPEPEKPSTSEDKKKQLFTKAFAFSIEFGFSIAIPLIVFGLAGKWLDAKFGTKYLVFVGIVLAITSTTVWITKRIKEMVKDLQ